MAVHWAACVRAFIPMEAGARAGRGGASRVSWEPCLALPPSPFTFSGGAVLLPTFPSHLSFPFPPSTSLLSSCTCSVPDGLCQVPRGQDGPDTVPVGLSPGGWWQRSSEAVSALWESALFSRIQYEPMSRTDGWSSLRVTGGFPGEVGIRI